MEQKTEENKTQKSEYHIQLLDNGIVVAQPEYDSIMTAQPEYNRIECEKFTNNGKSDDPAMQSFFGKLLWEDVCSAMDLLVCSRLKLTLTFEEDS